MRPRAFRAVNDYKGISIHALQAECDAIIDTARLKAKISIHALQAECDFIACLIGIIIKLFLSTHSKRSATLHACNTPFRKRYFYPRTPSGVRPAQRICWQRLVQISIHALQAECDIIITQRRDKNKQISIHALQAECDSLIKNMLIYVFLEYKFANNFKNTN